MNRLKEFTSYYNKIESRKVQIGLDLFYLALEKKYQGSVIWKEEFDFITRIFSKLQKYQLKGYHFSSQYPHILTQSFIDIIFN